MKCIVDLDPLVYIVGNVQWSSGNEDNEEGVRAHVRTFVSSVLAGTNCTEYVMFVQSSQHNNYRKEILPEYKSHRVTSEGMARWKGVIISELVKLGATLLYTIESDDALAMLAHKYSKEDYLIVENDKDLRQVPGNHYNPYKKDLKEKFFTVTAGEAALSLWMQLLTGDPSDMPGTLCGIEKVGPKTAFKMLNGEPYDTWYGIVLNAYIKKYGVSKGLHRMALTYDMVKLIDKLENSPLPNKEIETTLNTEFTQYKDVVEDLFENKTNELF